MSEQEQERPLTRRELRLREQAAQEAAGSTDAPEESIEIPSEVTDEMEPNFVEPEISPLNEDGTPRSRREIRALRDAALAELRAADSESREDAADEADADDVEAESEIETDEADSGELRDALDDSASSSDLADEELYGPPTEAFSIEELLEAEQSAPPTGDADSVAALFATEEEVNEEGGNDEDDADVEVVDVEVVEAEVVDELDVDVNPSLPDSEQDDEGSTAGADSVAGNLESVFDDLEYPSESDGGADAVGALIADAESVVAEDDGDELDDEVVEAEIEAESGLGVDLEADDSAEASLLENESDAEEPADEAEPVTGYSFPDIQPPEEFRSVFDDPSRHESMGAQSGTGDFDDLISRAVAQEGSTGGTGASALILPSHPGDTGGLAGPLGVTGDLFVTGSIELPKSLGETGGHAALLDSIETNQYLTGEQSEPVAAVSESGPTPVSALSAVSARRRPEVPVVAEPTKDKSKMPIVLALSGGGLLIIIAGAVILAATQGWFA